MSVYVDDMRASYGRMKMCHMLADSAEELHAMADRIGVARRWFQGNHYDVCLSKRALAVAAGAIEITQREAVKVIQRWRVRVDGHPPCSLCGPSGEGKSGCVECKGFGCHPKDGSVERK